MLGEELRDGVKVEWPEEEVLEIKDGGEHFAIGLVDRLL